VRSESGEDPAAVKPNQRSSVGDAALGSSSVVSLPGRLVAPKKRLGGSEDDGASRNARGSVGEGSPAGGVRDSRIQIGRVHSRFRTGAGNLGVVGLGGDLGVRIVSGFDADSLPGGAVDAEHRVTNDLSIGGVQYLARSVFQPLGGCAESEDPDPPRVDDSSAKSVVDLSFLGDSGS
jgi:hypothetical protein